VEKRTLEKDVKKGVTVGSSAYVVDQFDKLLIRAVFSMRS
jgi:hypothetical protein